MQKIREDIRVFGLPRCGGTFIWQIFREIFDTPDGELFPQTHNCSVLRLKQKLIIVIRDPREMVISHWRIYHAKYDGDNNMINHPSTKELDGNIEQMRQRIKALYGYLISDNTKILFRYEKFFNKPDYVMDKIEEKFKIKIDKETKDMITEKTSLKTNQLISDKVLAEAGDDVFESWDEESHIHGRHITSPEPGSYKNILTKSQIEYLDKELEFELNLLGYLK